MRRLIDRVDIRVSDMAASRAFYEAALAPLGSGVESESPDPNGGQEVGFGGGSGAEFAIHEPTSEAGQDTVTVGAHIAFTAAGPEAVAEFHRAGLRAGGRNLVTRGRGRCTAMATTARSCSIRTVTM